MALKEGMSRAWFSIPDDVLMQAKYWSSKRGISLSEYMRLCVVERIEREVGDYDLPSLEIARLYQLVDAVQALRVEQENTQSMISSALSSFTSLVRGEDYYGLWVDDEGNIVVGGDDDE